MYGYDTHSWRNSTEHRQQKKACAETTARYLAGTVNFQPVDTSGWAMCNCDVTEHPHDPQFWHGQPWPTVWTRKAA